VLPGARVWTCITFLEHAQGRVTRAIRWAWVGLTEDSRAAMLLPGTCWERTRRIEISRSCADSSASVQRRDAIVFSKDCALSENCACLTCAHVQVSLAKPVDVLGNSTCTSHCSTCKSTRAHAAASACEAAAVRASPDVRPSSSGRQGTVSRFPEAACCARPCILCKAIAPRPGRALPRPGWVELPRLRSQC
jgi:hypothetical protein